MTSAVTLEAFGPQHLALLLRWLDEPHVREFWGDPDEPMEIARDLPERFGQALIALDGEPVGYLRWARCDAELLASVDLGDLPDGSIDIDVFLGRESDRDRGTGSRALELLAERLFAEGAPLLGLVSSRRNPRAHRAFERAGFVRDRAYDDATFGPCWVYVRRPDAG